MARSPTIKAALRGGRRLISWHARARPKTFRMFLLQFLAFSALLFVVGAWVLFLFGYYLRQDVWSTWYALETWVTTVFVMLWAPDRKHRGSFRERVQQEWLRVQARRAR